jgi:hypothetical protein
MLFDVGIEKGCLGACFFFMGVPATVQSMES